MLYRCQCCGIEEEYQDGHAAFQAGWDCEPMFHTHVACPLCPAICIVMGATHTIAHALWEAEGRPAEFSLEKCADDKTLSSREHLEKAQEAVDRMVKMVSGIKEGGTATAEVKKQLIEAFDKSKH